MGERDDSENRGGEHDSDVSRTDDIDFEPESDLGDIGAARAKLKKLKDELEKVKKERQEYLDGWQRCKADSVNAKREAFLSTEQSVKRELQSFMEELIPALDGFDIAAGSESWALMDKGWRDGIDHIKNGILDVLKGHGVQRFGKAGEPFDPHEAVQEVDDGDSAPHTILKILRYGYRHGDRVIRPAQVIVRSA